MVKMKKEKQSENKIDDKIIGFFKGINSGGWFLIGAIIIIVALFIVGFYFAKTSNHFTNNKVYFEKTYFGEILLYNTQIPVSYQNGLPTEYINVDFRNDPRKLNDIPVEVNGKIEFVGGNKSVYISYDDVKICEDNGLAAANLGIFVKDIGFKREGAVTNTTAANLTGMPYVTCETHPDNTVLLIKNGPETMIKQTAENCYEIISKDCEILKATERFELAIIEQYVNTLA